MPESPEVQVLAEALAERLTGRIVTAVELDEFRALKTRNRPLDELLGAQVSAIRRFGKHLDVETDRAHLVISFGRAGWAVLSEEVPPPDAAPIARMLFEPEAGVTVFDAGSWLSLGLSVVDRPEEVGAIAKLGPDPLDPAFSAHEFDALFRRRKQLRALLQEQESLAGIGGAYSDEILHLARLDPLRHAAELSAHEREALFAATIETMREAVRARRGTSPGALKKAKAAAMRVHGRAGLPCPVCGDTVRDLPGTKGGGQYCPTCQNSDVP